MSFCTLRLQQKDNVWALCTVKYLYLDLSRDYLGTLKTKTDLSTSEATAI